MFDFQKNDLNNYTFTFTKDSKDPSKHTFKTSTDKIIVKYVPSTRNLNINLTFQGSKTSSFKQSEFYLVKNVNNVVTKTPFTLYESSGFKKVMNVPTNEKDGSKINYSIEKKSENKGYVTKIDGFNIVLTRILKLPHSGETDLLKTGTIFGTTFLLAVFLIRRRKRIMMFFKEYSIMK